MGASTTVDVLHREFAEILVPWHVVAPACGSELLVLLSVRCDPVEGVAQAVVVLRLDVLSIDIVHRSEAIHAFERRRGLPLVQHIECPADSDVDLFGNLAVFGAVAAEDMLGSADEILDGLHLSHGVAERLILPRQGVVQRVLAGGRIGRGPRGGRLRLDVRSGTVAVWPLQASLPCRAIRPAFGCC